MSVNKKVLACLAISIVLSIVAVIASVVCICLVTRDSDKVQSIAISNTYLEMEVGQTEVLFVVINGNSLGKERRWTSNNERVATVNVSNGEVTAIAAGAAIITISVDDKSASCTVYVRQPQAEPAPIEPDVTEHSLKFKTLTVNSYNVSGLLPNDCDEFSFEEEIVAGKDVTYSVCRDLECTQTIPSKVVRLEQGYNKFYVLAMFKDNSSKLYRVTIRKGLLIVTFDTDGGDTIEPLEVEYGATVTLPSATKSGYDFVWWTCNGVTYHDSATVTEDMSFHAEYDVKLFDVTLYTYGCDATLAGDGLYVINCEVTVTAEQQDLGYGFLGWYDGEELLTDNFAYMFKMPARNIVLTAKYGLDERIANLDFISTDATFVINGFKEGADTSELVIPEYATFIEEGAFASAETIDKVTWLAVDCQHIVSSDINDKSIFYNCVINDFYLDKTVTSLDGNIFYLERIANLYYNGTIEDWCEIEFGSYAANPLSAAQNWYVNGELIEDLVIPNGVSRIKAFAFYNGSSIKSVSLPESLFSIGRAAFAHCNNLVSVLWADEGLTSIGLEAFNYCEKLTGQTILPSTLQTLGQRAFANTKIVSIVIPTSVTQIWSFGNTPEAIYYKGTAEQWNSITKPNVDIELDNATIYYYSETEPQINDDGTAYDGDYWHYVDNEIVIWTKEENN